MIKTSCFSQPIFNPKTVESTDKDSIHFEKLYCKFPTMVVKDDAEESGFKRIDNPRYKKPAHYNMDNPTRNDSLKRSRDKAFDIALCNDFKYFITFTLDEKKISRYDTTEISRKLKNWLDNKVRRNNFKYIIFPEYHKKENENGQQAIHFHGLCNGDLTLTDSNHYTKKMQKIYNCDDWCFGYSTVIGFTGSKLKIVHYVMKYITKENHKIFGKFYYSGGKGLVRDYPASYSNEDFLSFAGEEYTIPSANMSVKYRNIALDNDTDNLEDVDIDCAIYHK